VEKDCAIVVWDAFRNLELHQIHVNWPNELLQTMIAPIQSRLEVGQAFYAQYCDGRAVEAASGRHPHQVGKRLCDLQMSPEWGGI
jgi:hypothetical protein